MDFDIAWYTAHMKKYEVKSFKEVLKKKFCY